MEHHRFMGVHDATHANLEGGASQQGHLILAAHASITNCRVLVSVLSWQRKKITTHANLEGGASQQGHLILAAHASITNCRVLVSVLSWQRKKIKSVVRSSLAAETCSMSTCQEHLDWMRTMWEQMTRGDFVLENYEQFLTARPRYSCHRLQKPL